MWFKAGAVRPEVRTPPANARSTPAGIAPLVRRVRPSTLLNDVALSVLAAGLVGYTMRDIRYKWNAGIKSVGISKEVELPQFRVLGHRQRATVINLSTGNRTARDLHHHH